MAKERPFRREQKAALAPRREDHTPSAQGVLVKPLVMRQLTELIRGLMEE